MRSNGYSLIDVAKRFHDCYVAQQILRQSMALPSEFIQEGLERETGIELATSSLGNCASLELALVLLAFRDLLVPLGHRRRHPKLILEGTRGLAVRTPLAHLPLKSSSFLLDSCPDFRSSVLYGFLNSPLGPLLRLIEHRIDLLLEELSGGFTEVRKHHFAVVAEGEAEHEVLHFVKVLWLDGRKLIQQKTGVPL
jgi:hypothetical protein